MKDILLVLSVIISLGYSFNDVFDQKFCDKNLPDTKIAEFESCDQYLPKEILDNSEACLKELKLATTYRSFRTTICDDKTRRNYNKCFRNKMKVKRSSQTTTEISEEKVESLRKHEVCMRKALGIKDEAQS